VLVRFVSQVNRSEIQFVPLGQDAKPMKDADWKYVQWGVEMAGAAAMAAPGISVNAFPIGTIFSVKLSSAAGSDLRRRVTRRRTQISKSKASSRTE
jgi:hypothetical protein